MARIFQSLTRIVNLVLRKDNQDVIVRPSQSTTYSQTTYVDLPRQDPTDGAVELVGAYTAFDGNDDDNALVKIDAPTDGTDSTMLQKTGVKIDDSNNITGVADLTATNLTANTAVKLKETGGGSDLTSLQAAASTSGAITVVLPAVAGTLATLAGTEELTNKKLTGGAASTDNEWLVPKKNGQSGLSSTEGNIMFDSTTGVKKLTIYTGSAWKAVGGGLITEAKSYSDGDFAAEAGKWYLVDMGGASAQRTITLPAGAAEAVIAVTVKNNSNTSYLLTVDGNSSETIWYNDTANADVDFGYEEMTAQFMWDTVDSHWLVSVSQTPVSGTWGGDLYLTGNLYGCISPNARAGSDAAVALTSTSSRFQVVTLTAARTYTLPSTDIKTGDTFTFINRATTDSYRLTINSSGGNAVDWIVNGKITVMALQDTPTTAAHWATTEAISEYTQYTTTTTGLGTPSISNVYYRRSNRDMDVVFNITGGTHTSDIANFTLPSSTSGSASSFVGSFGCNYSPFTGVVVTGGGSPDKLYLVGSAHSWTTGSAGTTWTSGAAFTGRASLAITTWTMFN